VQVGFTGSQSGIRGRESCSSTFNLFLEAQQVIPKSSDTGQKPQTSCAGAC